MVSTASNITQPMLVADRRPHQGRVQWSEIRTLQRTSRDTTELAQHIPNLRNFIQARSSQEPANRGDSGIFIIGPRGAGIRFSVRPHGPEFKAFKNLAAQTDASLPVDQWSRRTQFNEYCDERNE